MSRCPAEIGRAGDIARGRRFSPGFVPGLRRSISEIVRERWMGLDAGDGSTRGGAVTGTKWNRWSIAESAVRGHTGPTMTLAPGGPLRRGSRIEPATAAPGGSLRPAPIPTPGDLLFGRYRLVKRLGIGGTAEVWQARDEQLSRDVAIKLLHRHLVPDEQSRERFAGEAKAVAALSHPGIVAVHDIVVGDDMAAIVLELVEGKIHLRAHRGARGRCRHLPPPRSPRRLRDAAPVGARARHHPSRRQARQTSCSRPTAAPASSISALPAASRTRPTLLTMPGTAIMRRTLRYMSPEQLLGQPATARPRAIPAGLGAVLYEMLAGQPPFPATTPANLVADQRNGAPGIARVDPRAGRTSRSWRSTGFSRGGNDRPAEWPSCCAAGCCVWAATRTTCRRRWRRRCAPVQNLAPRRSTRGDRGGSAFERSRAPRVAPEHGHWRGRGRAGGRLRSRAPRSDGCGDRGAAARARDRGRRHVPRAARRRTNADVDAQSRIATRCRRSSWCRPRPRSPRSPCRRSLQAPGRTMTRRRSPSHRRRRPATSHRARRTDVARPAVSSVTNATPRGTVRRRSVAALPSSLGLVLVAVFLAACSSGSTATRSPGSSNASHCAEGAAASGGPSESPSSSPIRSSRRRPHRHRPPR